MAQKYRWSEAWECWVPISRPIFDTLRAEERALVVPRPHRCNRLDCIDCYNTGVRYADYLKTKRAEQI